MKEVVTGFIKILQIGTFTENNMKFIANNLGKTLQVFHFTEYLGMYEKVRARLNFCLEFLSLLFYSSFICF